MWNAITRQQQRCCCENGGDRTTVGCRRQLFEIKWKKIKAGTISTYFTKQTKEKELCFKRNKVEGMRANVRLDTLDASLSAKRNLNDTDVCCEWSAQCWNTFGLKFSQFTSTWKIVYTTALWQSDKFKTSKTNHSPVFKIL